MQSKMLALMAALLLALSALPSGVGAAPTQQTATCVAFSQTGFSVCDDPQARFAAAFQRWGLQKIGYPVSQRYIRDGFVTQAFQKAIMQWRSESQSVVLVNIFDDLHNAGFDERLLSVRQTPRQLPPGWDNTVDFNQIVQKRQALLNVRPALRATYFASTDPLTFFGLPTSEVTDMGNHYAIRLQRAVLQEWKENVPWARAGEVTIANGGDIAKELGSLPAAALVPGAPITIQVPGGGPSVPAPAPTATTGPVTAPSPTPVPSKAFTGSVVQTFTNCSVTQVIGTVIDRSGNPVKDVRVRLWWPGGQTYRTTSGSYVRPETNAAGWDFFLNSGSISNAWFVAIEDNAGNLLSDPVEVRTAGTCNAGDVNVAKVQFIRN